MRCAGASRPAAAAWAMRAASDVPNAGRIVRDRFTAGSNARTGVTADGRCRSGWRAARAEPARADRT
jgi:hypothetical protein